MLAQWTVIEGTKIESLRLSGDWELLETVILQGCYCPDWLRFAVVNAVESRRHCSQHSN